MKIRSLLITREYYNVSDLCEILRCSEATLRNDLRSLEESGYVKRVYGGVMSTGNTPFEAGIPIRVHAYEREKQAICSYAVSNILSPGKTIVIDAGTTGTELARQIAELPYGLAVITNSLTAAQIIAQNDRHRLYLAGGSYDPSVGSFHDRDTMNFLTSAHADIFFLCPNGISGEVGITVPGQSEAELKQLLVSRSSRVIVLADHSKLDRVGFRVVCSLGEADMIITDASADPGEVESLRNAGAKIALAPLST